MESDLAVLRMDLRKYMQIWANAVAHTAADGLTDVARQAIENFYGSYDPRVYLRTNNILNNSYARYLKNNAKIYYGGVELSPNRMFEYAAKTANGHVWPKEKVFDTAIFGGSHGGWAYSTPPYDYILNFKDSALFLQACIDAGDEAARAGSYQILQF